MNVIYVDILFVVNFYNILSFAGYCQIFKAQ